MWQFIPLIAQTVSSGLNAIGSARQAAAYRREGRRLATDIEAQGEFDATNAERNLALILGAQRADFAAQGLDVTQGTQAALREETQTIGELDIQQIRENAMREAAAVRRGARIQSQGAQMNAWGSGLAAFGAMAGMGANAWDVYNRGRGMRALRRAVPTLLADPAWF